MCGISGYYALNGISDTSRDRFIDNSKINHAQRGPDDFGSYVSKDNRLVLTHSRLSLVDLSHNGHQPMKKEGRVLVFNGEIYNFRTIKTELENSGYSFVSTSDTEVILAAYDKWGTDCFNLFNGPFALAIYDERTSEIILARDRVGEKPLYYYKDEGDSAIYFGSTIKQIMQVKPKAWKLDEERIISDIIFNFWSDKKRTHIAGIQNIETGTYVVIDTVSNSQTTHSYWDLTSNEFTDKSETEIISDVSDILLDAVDIRVQLDAPIGAILSGGLDSTLLTALSRNRLAYAPNCFTLSRNQHIDEDLFYAQKYCEENELPHNKVELTDADLGIDALVAATLNMEEPSLDQVYLYISRNYETAHQKGMKAVLNGQGADEIFLGYLDYYSFLRDEENYKNQQAFEDYWFNASPVSRYMNTDQVKGIIHANIMDNYVPVASNDSLNSVLRFGVKTHLQSLLAQEDKQSMRWSVECRTVFTDYRLVEYMSAVPSRVKIFDNKEKYVLRKVAEKHLPNYIINREKLGFPDLPDNRGAFVDGMIEDGILVNSLVLSNIFSLKVLEYPDELPLSMKWKMCSIAILERSLL